MMTLQDISQALQDRRLERVAEVTGLHYNTVREIRDNPHCNPTWRVLKALNDYLERTG